MTPAEREAKCALARFRFYCRTAELRGIDDWGTIMAAIPQQRDAVLISACELLESRNRFPGEEAL